MRELLSGWMLVLAVGAAVAIAAKRVRIPWNVALVAVGLVLVLLDLLPRAPLDPEVVLVAILPVLVFESALSTDVGHLREASRPILVLALPGVAISLGATALIARYALDLPIETALVLGALLAITDTVSVILAFRAVRVPARLAAIVEGESLFNDGTALVLVAATASIAVGEASGSTGVLKALVLAIVGGLAVGALVAAAGVVVLRATPDHLTTILATVVICFAGSLGAEAIHASGVIAVVVIGLAVGPTVRRNLPPSRMPALAGFWEAVAFCLNVIVFLQVGMQVDASALLREAPAIGLALVALHAGRAVAVYGGLSAFGRVLGAAVPARWKHVLVAGNIKGALSIAAVLALPDALPFRGRLVTIVYGVTIVTLIVQGLSLPRVLSFLGVALPPAHARLDAARAKLVSARAGQRELDTLLALGLLSRRDHAERRAAFQREALDAERELRDAELGASGLAVDHAVLDAQRAALDEATRRGVVGPDAARSEIEALDEQRHGRQVSEEG